MTPFFTSLHSMFNVPLAESVWSLWLQTVPGASRSLFLFSCFLVLTFPSLQAQPDRDKQESEIVSVPAGENFHRWYGPTGGSHFIQVSATNQPLSKWIWLPAIEAGNDACIQHIVGGTAASVFYRLKYTDQIPGPGETLDTAEFDHDGLSNLREIVPPPPLLASDATDPLDPDTDHDGLADGYERTPEEKVWTYAAAPAV